MIKCDGNPIKITYDEDVIYTVFPMNYPKEYESRYLPQDFSNYYDAKEYAESLDCDYLIEEC